MRFQGAIVLLAALLALATAQQRKWGCGGGGRIFRQPGYVRGGPGCERPVGFVGQPWVTYGTPNGDGLGVGGGTESPRARSASGCALRWVWAPRVGSTSPVLWGGPSTRREQRLHCFVPTGSPRGPPSLCAQAMQWGSRGDRVPQPVGHRRDTGGALTPSSPALQLS